MKHVVHWDTADVAKKWKEGIVVLVQSRRKNLPTLYGHFRPDWVGSEHYGRDSRYLKLDEVFAEPFPK